jgi:hypothetical protein
LSANRTITPAGVVDYITNENRPTLVIQSLKAGDTHHKTDDDEELITPPHLIGVKGREFISLKIYFPKVSKNFKVVNCRASLDYIRRLREENADDSEGEE